MNYLILKDEVSYYVKKMLGQIEPRLRRSNIMFNSFGSYVSNASEEFTWIPEMPFSKIFSQPRMFLQKPKSRSSFKQLQSFTNTHCWRQLNKQVDMVNSDMKLVNFTSILNSNFYDKSLYINYNSIEFHGVFGIFRLPNKVECILSEGVFKTFQFHFFAPQSRASKKAHANFVNLFQEGSIYPHHINNSQE